jgi:predicted permease
MLGLIDRALLSPPAHIADADRLFTLTFERDLENDAPARMTTTSYPAYEAIRDNLSNIAGVAAWQRMTTSAIRDGLQVSLDAMLVSGSYFGALGANAFMGRTITADDDARPTGAPNLVISHAAWLGLFGGDRMILGKRVAIRGVDFEVVGVMPPGFSGHSPISVDVWLPFHAAMQHAPGWDGNRYRNFLSVLVRLTGESNPARVATQAAAGLPDPRRVSLAPIVRGEPSAMEERIALWLTAVSSLVLVVSIANAGTLLLVRGAARRRDLAIRRTLGATAGRLRTQILLEALFVAAAALAVAWLLGLWLDEVVRRVLLPSLVQAAGVNARLMTAALVAGLAAFGLAAAASLAHTRGTLRDAGPGGESRGSSRKRAQRALLVVQTTLSVLLLAGAGVFGRSLHNLVSQDFGMRMADVILVRFEPGPDEITGQRQLFASALERVRALPGVELAAPIQIVPFTGFHVIPVSAPGFVGSPNVDGQLPYLIAATPELLQILDISVVEGRRFVDADERGSPVVIVSETMARAVWPGVSALGKCIRIGFDPSFDPFTAAGPPPPPSNVPCREVIGVVRDVRQRSVVPTGSEAHLMQYYVPFSQVPAPPAAVGDGPGIRGLMVRASVGVESLAAPIRRIVVNGRGDLPFLQVRKYADVLDRQIRPWRQGTALLALFGAFALAVAGIGLYAAFAHSVSTREREMAIRIAVGARVQRVLLMILREAVSVAAIGAALGCATAVVAGRWIQSMLFGTAPWDPVVLAGATVLMLLIAAVATFVPARAASQADPATLLKAE